MGFDPHKPYNDLPLIPPSADLETKPVLKKAVSAGRALAELKGLGQTIPNQTMLVNSLTLQEAKDSSEIENIVTTNDALFKAFTIKSNKVDPATKEVLRYREALWKGYEKLKKSNILTTNMFIEIVQTIKQNTAGVRVTPGTVISNTLTGEIIYTPPEGEKIIRDKLKNLEDYINSENSIDPLIKLAVIHYQFEAIHPFTDGNGRTGRIINILYLVLQDLLEYPVLYHSKSIIERKSEYYKLLQAVTKENQWEPWILYILEVIEETASFSRKQILDIRDLMAETIEKAKRELPNSVYSKELIELLFRQPYCKIRFLIEENIASRNIASKYLSELTKIGILRKEKSGTEVIYLNIELYDLLSRS